MHELKTDQVANVKCLLRMAKFLIDSEEREIRRPGFNAAGCYWKHLT